MSKYQEILDYVNWYQKEYPDKEDIINSISAIFSDFVSEDYEGITENRIYRLFLNTLKEILNTAFENNCSKSFLRSFFKRLNNKNVNAYLSSLAKSIMSPALTLTSIYLGIFFIRESSYIT